MSLDDTAHALAGIEGAIAHHRSDREVSPPRPFPLSIAISRQGGIEAEPIARALHRRLGWHVYDRELLHRVADELGASPERLRQFDESGLNLFSDFARSFGLQDNVTESRYVHQMFRAIWDIASKEHGIFVGRGSPHMLPSRSTLRVFLRADFSERVRALQRTSGLSQEDAASQVRRLDTERQQFGRQFLNRSLYDPAHYDLVLDPIRFGDEGAAAVIACAMQELQNR
jgi:cytidylate kinase